MGQTLWGYLNESYWAVLLYGNVYCTVKGGSNIDVGSDNSNEQISTELWRRANARNVRFVTLNGGLFTLSTQLIILNYPVRLSHRRSTTVSLQIYPLIQWSELFNLSNIVLTLKSFYWTPVCCHPNLAHEQALTVSAARHAFHRHWVDLRRVGERFARNLALIMRFYY